MKRLSFALKDMDCSVEPFKGEGQLYHVLYKTTCIQNGKIYIGIHSSLYIKDRYIGNGINSNIIKRKSLGYGISHLKRSVEKYGYSSFKRENLLYFKKKKDLLKAEEIIVNQIFIESEETLNCCVGGFKPPTKRGKNNGNYGKKWSLEKKIRLSEFFKKYRDTKGEKNNKAIPVFCINLITEEIIRFGCMKEAGQFLHLKPDTVRKYRNQLDHIFKGFWIIVEDKENLDLNNTIKENLLNLSVRNQYYRRWYRNEDEKDLYQLNSGGKWYREQYWRDYQKIFKHESKKN